MELRNKGLFLPLFLSSIRNSKLITNIFWASPPYLSRYINPIPCCAREFPDRSGPTIRKYSFPSSLYFDFPIFPLSFMVKFIALQSTLVSKEANAFRSPLASNCGYCTLIRFNPLLV